MSFDIEEQDTVPLLEAFVPVTHSGWRMGKLLPDVRVEDAGADRLRQMNQ